MSQGIKNVKESNVSVYLVNRIFSLMFANVKNCLIRADIYDNIELSLQYHQGGCFIKIVIN